LREALRKFVGFTDLFAKQVEKDRFPLLETPIGKVAASEKVLIAYFSYVRYGGPKVTACHSQRRAVRRHPRRHCFEIK
jgi:hypothetical protein